MAEGPPGRLAEWLRRRREEMELSRAQVAVRARGEVSADHIRKVEYGERQPSARVLRALAGAYGVDPVWLLRLAGQLPETAGAEEPAAHTALGTWAQIESAVKSDRDINAEERHVLLFLLRRVFKPVLDDAAKRRARVRVPVDRVGPQRAARS